MSTPRENGSALPKTTWLWAVPLPHRLELEGYTPPVAHGTEALEGLLTTRPGLVVCDIILPDMSGEDVFLRALPQLGSIPFIRHRSRPGADAVAREGRRGRLLRQPYCRPLCSSAWPNDQVPPLSASGDLAPRWRCAEWSCLEAGRR
jgi:hypothetical protein